MADVRIIGGGDNPTPVRADLEGHLKVRAIEVPEISIQSWHGESYRLLAEVTLGDTLLTPMFYMKNTRSGRNIGREQMLVIHKWVVSSDAAIHAELWAAAAYTSGGTPRVPSNLNRSKSDTPSVDTFDASLAPLVLNNANGLELESLFLAANAPHQQKFEGALLLPQGKTIAAYAQGAAADKVRMMIDFYWAPIP